jgi:nicotinamide-nucleotide amidase
MDAEIIAVGSEMLTPQRVDTNSLYLTGELNNLGVEVKTKCVIGDDLERLSDAVRRALSRSEIVILSGGLGPTEDDMTREAVAQALDRKLVFHPEIAEALAQRFAQFKRAMAEINKRQAFVIQGAHVLPNDRGTAPGQWIEESGAVAMLLPGPPHELKAMFADHPHAAVARDRHGRIRSGPAHRAGLQKIREPGDHDFGRQRRSADSPARALRHRGRG